MRSTLATAATITSIVLASLTPAHRVDAAAASPKAKDLVTAGATSRPDARPADPRAPRLERAGHAVSPAAVAAPAVEKSPAFTTSLPASGSSDTPEQHAKLAAGIASAPAPASGEASSAKPAAMSTIRPPATTGITANAATAIAKGVPASPAPGFARAHSATEALGTIPRAEWTLGTTEKPRDVSTIGPPLAPTPAPGPLELQRRAAATTAAGARKPADVTTSRPRDPSQPPTQTLKAGDTSNAAPEVKP
jgi:hypothetical protein